MHTFPALPGDELLDVANGEVGVRLAAVGDVPPLYELLSDPELPHIRQRPESQEDVEAWIRDLHARRNEALTDRSLLLVVTIQGAFAGLITAQLKWLTPSGVSEGEVPTVEYTADRSRTLKGRGVVRQGIEALGASTR